MSSLRKTNWKITRRASGKIWFRKLRWREREIRQYEESTERRNAIVNYKQYEELNIGEAIGIWHNNEEDWIQFEVL